MKIILKIINKSWCKKNYCLTETSEIFFEFTVVLLNLMCNVKKIYNIKILINNFHFLGRNTIKKLKTQQRVCDKRELW